MWKEVEALEDHTDLFALLGDFLVVHFVKHATFLHVPHKFAIHRQPTRAHLFQMIHAAQERGFATAGRPHDA